MRVVKSQLSHSLGVLALLAEAGRGARLTDLAEGLGAPKSSAQRLLMQLAEEGWVEQDADTGFYRLTFRMAVLGQRYLQAIGIADATGAILEKLARETRELARLTIVDGERLVWIGSAQGAISGLMYQPAMGGRIVSFATANGKAWLATLRDEAAVARIVAAEGLGTKPAPEGLGPKAVRSVPALLRNLAVVRSRGYAVSDEEAEPGVAAIAVAVRDPADGRTLGTASIAGPLVRLPPQRHAPIAATLATAALELARAWPATHPRLDSRTLR